MIGFDGQCLDLGPIGRQLLSREGAIFLCSDMACRRASLLDQILGRISELAGLAASLDEIGRGQAHNSLSSRSERF